MKKFANHVHPLKGVRFSPYAHVDEDSDKVFTAQAVVGLLEDKQKQLWGYYDGSGDDILLTFADYYQHFIYSHDFLNAKRGAIVKNKEKITIGLDPDLIQELDGWENVEMTRRYTHLRQPHLANYSENACQLEKLGYNE